MLALGLAVFAVMVLLVALSVAWVSGLRDVSGSRTGNVADPETTQSHETRPDSARHQAIQPVGVRPSHLGTDPVSTVPNQQAITQALWAPGIDHRYVPQGQTGGILEGITHRITYH